MGNTESRQHPKQKKNTVIVPNVIGHTLNEKRQYTAKYAETNRFVRTIHGIFAEGEGTLREREDKAKKCKEGKNSRFHGDL